ncbi:hypothetical protein HU200_037206 [Digitaria exilis]|uniref:Uncharacterized protein n=1 Tax=Digitaria exilis TaxID=1010633 RepID=A0A835BL50_9POAL|nr:hypothetical protein HU200_037206 [Digitaria exilis]
MACSLLPLHAPLSSPHRLLSSRPAHRALPLILRGPGVLRHRPPPPPRALPDIAAGAASGIRDALADAFLSSPPTWRSAAASNLAVFVAGSPVLLSGLSASGFAAAYLLGTLTWRAFGAPGFLVVVAYFVVVSRFDWSCISRNGLVYFDFMIWELLFYPEVGFIIRDGARKTIMIRSEWLISDGLANIQLPRTIPETTLPAKSPFLMLYPSFRSLMLPVSVVCFGFGMQGTAVTKLKIKQKEAQGVAEKRGGRRGPGSVIGSSAAGCVCALLSIYHVGGTTFSELWRLGFVASFCTKLSDTVSSEIGKAFGRTTYLVTTFKVVPRGTEGAISIEGTFAGILASVFLASVGYLLGQVNVSQVAVCLLASQIANYGESYIGATMQDKEGFEWLNNDIVNVLNISIGAILAVLMQQLLVSWSS